MSTFMDVPGVKPGALDAAVAAKLADPTSATRAAGNTTFVPKWQPLTAYTAGYAVLSPAGDTVTAIASFTSGASFNPANWNFSPTYATKASPALTGAATLNGVQLATTDDAFINSIIFGG